MTKKLGQQFENKEEYVKSVFAAIAPVYDLVNSVISLGMVRGWYKFLLNISELKPGEKALDVGAGTGEITFLLAEKAGPRGSVIGLDFSNEMLNIAREKLKKRVCRDCPAPLVFVQGNALNLPFPDQSFDVVTTGFTLRNVTDIPLSVREMFRVCKYGGKVTCLEISRPAGVWGWGFGLYFDGLIPLLGTMIGQGQRILGRPPAYSWLSQSLREFPQGRRMENILWDSGLREIKAYPLSGGVVTVYKGKKPEGRT